MYLAKVYITLKEGVLDPQGSAALKALHTMDYSHVQDVRIGKFLEVRIDEDDKAEVEKQLSEMCDRLLANPVIEEYSFDLVEVEST